MYIESEHTKRVADFYANEEELLQSLSRLISEVGNYKLSER